MKSIDTERSIFLKFGDFLQRKGHADKEMDNRQIKNIKGPNSIFLTFDFCPTSELDSEVINWLIDNKIKSSLFICVEWIKRNSDKDLSFIDNPLFTIGGHGFNHIDPLEQSDEQQAEDIDKCIKYWKERGKELRWYRVPYGHPTDTSMQKFNAWSIKCASWTGPVLDKKAKNLKKDTFEEAIEYLEKYMKPGDLYVAHPNGEGTKTLEIIKEIKNLADSKRIGFDKL